MALDRDEIDHITKIDPAEELPSNLELLEPTDLVMAATAYLDDTVLLYGGGIERTHQTKEILDAGADAVVVGDCFHDDPDQSLQTIP